MLHKAQSKPKKEKPSVPEFDTDYQVQFLTAGESELKHAMATRQVSLKAVHDTPVLILTRMNGMIKVILHDTIPKISDCMSNSGIINWYRGRHFYNTIVSFVLPQLLCTYRNTRRLVKLQSSQSR